MADITTRAGKGSPLTNDEVDANFTNLNTDKAENGANSDITSLAGITGGVSTADYVDFDTLASSISRQSGRLTWNNEEGCLEVGLKGNDVTLQVGQEVVTRAYNADSSAISNGDIVYFWSTSGEIVACKKFISDASIAAELVLGVATEDISVDGYGYITEFGLVRTLDTAAFDAGDIIYASDSVSGQLTNNKPSSPSQVVIIGICIQSDSTDGIVLVRPHEIPEAGEIRYDNTDSELLATNVKSALDELDLVKADIDLLTSNVTFYLTSANDPVIAGYKEMVTSVIDTRYDEVATDYLTGTISSSTSLIQAWVSDPNVLVGDIAGIVIPIVGNIRKDAGSGDARFYFEVYIREDDGTETLITTSNISDYITATTYVQQSLSATVSLQTFTDTDRVVIKLYGQTGSSTATYELQLGGSSPFRSLFPVPVSVVPAVANANAIVAVTTNFDGKLSGNDDTVQKALETLDDHTHQASEITGLSASNTTTTTTGFSNLLSGTDTDVQKALNTLDDVALQEITSTTARATTTNPVTINAALDVDDLKLDGDTISNDGAAVDGNIVLSPKGSGEVDISKVDIDGGAIDGTTIGGTTPSAGTFTDLTVNTTATFAGATIADLGTVTTADINGGTIDGVDLSATIADIGNINIDGNSIISTNGNGNIDLTPNGEGEVNISKVDINAGAIDGTTIGAAAAAAGNFTALDVSTSASFAGATIDDLGAVTTADINGGTIDNADITVGAGKTLSVINGTLTLADNQISGDKVHGGIISNFQSTGIDDNATSTAITIDANENVGINNPAPTYTLDVTNNSTAYAPAARFLSNGDAANWARVDIENVNATGTLFLYQDNAGAAGLRNDAAQSLSFATDAETRMTIDVNGNVGIGKNPEKPLHVAAASLASSDGTVIKVQNTKAVALGERAGIEFHNDSFSGSDKLAGIYGEYTNYDAAGYAGALVMATQSLGASNVTERLRISSSGDVGIGANSVLSLGASFTTVDVRGASGSGFVLGQEGANNQSGYFYGDSDGLTLEAFGAKTLEFRANGAERMRIKSSGDLNLGLTAGTPTGGVVLQNGAGVKSGPVMSIGGTDTAVTTGDTIGALTFVSADPSFTNIYSDGIGAQIAAVAETGVGGGYGLSFTTGVTTGSNRDERLRITYDGRVGINHSTDFTNFNGKLIVNGGTLNGSTFVDIHNDNDNQFLKLGINTNLGLIAVDNADQLAFGVMNNTAETSLTSEWARFDSSGHLLVGRTSTSSSATDYGSQLYSSGVIYQYTAAAGASDMHRWYNSAGTLAARINGNGDITASGNVTAYSDERLKDNVETLDGSKVYEMRGVSFTKDGEAGSGVIAQELQKVAPELVHEGEEYLSVAYGNLVGYLIEAVKDLKAEVEALKGAK